MADLRDTTMATTNALLVAILIVLSLIFVGVVTLIAQAVAC
jgi:hypothetical protein